MNTNNKTQNKLKQLMLTWVNLVTKVLFSRYNSPKTSISLSFAFLHKVFLDTYTSSSLALVDDNPSGNIFQLVPVNCKQPKVKDCLICFGQYKT